MLRLPPGTYSALTAGSSAARNRLDGAIQRIASTARTTVLIRGPRGSGKRFAARLVHGGKAGANGPFLTVNSGESSSPGFLQRVFDPGGLADRARGGSLVFTEVSALTREAQTALGDRLARGDIEARVISTTSLDLEAEAAAGRFEEDLFYRVNVLTLDVPPLASRTADVPEMAATLIAASAAEIGLSVPKLSIEAAGRLLEHPWPGDLAELQGVLYAAVARAEGAEITPEHLALPTLGAPLPAVDPWAGERDLRALEERTIRLVLAETGGNKSLAARRLGLNRQTLYNKLALLERSSIR